MRQPFCAARVAALAFIIIGFASVGAAGFDAPLRIVAPAAPGTGWDQLGHAIEEAVRASGSDTSVEITNVPGSGGRVGLAQFVREPGPGSPLLVTGLSMVGTLVLNRSPVGLDQVTPIVRLAAEHLLIAVAADSTIDSVAAFAEALRNDPGKITWAGGPAGSVAHVASLLFARAVGVEAARLVYIPYLGTADALAAVEEGRVTAAIIPRPDLDLDPKNAPIRILAVTAPARLEGVEAPALREAGIDLDIANWRGIVAPIGISTESRASLSRQFEALSRTPGWDEALKRRRWQPAFLPTDAFAGFLAAEQVRVKEVLKAAGVIKRVAD